jgi:membrane protease YdiL (CAAX protease family)
VLLSERLGLAGRYAESLPEPLRSGLTRLALMLESDPARTAVLLGQAVPQSQLRELSPGYRWAAQESNLTSEDRYQLQAHAYFGLQRLGLCLLVAGSAALTALALAWTEDGAPDPGDLVAPSLGWRQPLAILLAWDLSNRFLLPSLGERLSPTLGSWSVFWGCQLLSYGLLGGLMVALAPHTWRPWLGFSWRQTFPGYLLCLLLIPLTNAAVSAVSGIHPFLTDPTLGLLAAASRGMLVPLTLLAVIVGPIFEELLFRGWLLGSLRERWGDRWGVIGSALLFALVHGSFWNAPALFVGGLVLGWVALRSGSLACCVVAHGLWNLTWLCQAMATLP